MKPLLGTLAAAGHALSSAVGSIHHEWGDPIPVLCVVAVLAGVRGFSQDERLRAFAARALVMALLLSAAAATLALTGAHHDSIKSRTVLMMGLLASVVSLISDTNFATYYEGWLMGMPVVRTPTVVWRILSAILWLAAVLCLLLMDTGD